MISSTTEPVLLDDEELLPDELPSGGDVPPLAQTRFAMRPASPSGLVWKVLIVDDDRDVRHVSELALRGLTVDERPVELLFAANAAEARVVLSTHGDIAVAVVDVVMESRQAGLDLIRWIRAELGNWSVRLVVRTGEPGNAPEAAVMANHELHDYLSKSETTARRLVSCVTGAVRAWRDQQTIRLQRSGLETVLLAVDGLFANRELDLLLELVVRTAAEMLTPSASEGWFVAIRDPAGTDLACLAAIGDEAVESAELRVADLESGRVTVRDDVCIYPVDVDADTRYVLALRRKAITPWECKLLELYGHAVSLSLRHRSTWESAFKAIQSALAEREVMLREIHHRVKNNLQITASLLTLQADRCASDEARGAILDSSARVRAMALVHQQLYAGDDFANLSLDEVCRKLATLLRVSLAPDAMLAFSLVPVVVTIEQAIPCGLILNEFLTNALKHGRDTAGKVSITVELSETPFGVDLTVRDAGPGLPGALEELSTRSLGLQMIHALTRQLKGTLSVGNGPGACFTLHIPRLPQS